MKKKDDISPGSADEWLMHAESDLEYAIIGLKRKKVLASQICFHAQQCAEKAIKAVLRHYNVDFPLTHDIEQLLILASNYGIKVPKSFSNVSKLTPYAVQTRYPGFWGNITKKEAERAIKLGEKILKWAKNTVES